VALGDSYSAGEGAPDPARPNYLVGTDDYGPRPRRADLCHRSLHAYPVLLAAELHYELRAFAACSGSTSEDFSRPNHEFPDGEKRGQAAWLSTTGELPGKPNPGIKLVTLTLGGNDIGFSQLALDCIGGKYLRGPRRCHKTVETTRKRLESEGPKLATAYGLVRRLAPNARVLVLGYPRLFPDRPPALCGIGEIPTIARSEMLALNRLVDSLDETILARTQAVGGIDYVDVSAALSGHTYCSSLPWVNKLRDIFSKRRRRETGHPTIAGQAAFARLTAACYRDRAQCGPHDRPVTATN
jgi:lysophospholipase L1-like esterase